MKPIPFTLEKVEISQLFGLQAGAGKQIQIRKYAKPHPFVPRIDPEYTFDRDELRTLIEWYYAWVEKNLYLFGPTGCGKTSMLEQFCARVGLPVYKMSCNNKRVYSEFIGQWVLKSVDSENQPQTQVQVDSEEGEESVTRKGTVTTPDGHQVAVTMEYNLGPVPSALIHQGVLLLDEADQLTPTTFMSFNEVLDDFPATYIPEINRKIEAGAFFRVAATGNSNGWGDMTGQYRGVQTQNIATLDRFLHVEKRETTEEDEIEYLKKKAPKLPVESIKLMVKLAMDARAAAVGQDGGSLNVPITRRTLRQWARKIESLLTQKVKQPMTNALEAILLKKGEPVDQEALRAMWKRISTD